MRLQQPQKRKLSCETNFLSPQILKVQKSGPISHILNKSPGNVWNHLENADHKYLKFIYPKKILENEEAIVEVLRKRKKHEESQKQMKWENIMQKKEQTKNAFTQKQQQNRSIYKRLGLINKPYISNYSNILKKEVSSRLSSAKTVFRPQNTFQYEEFRDIPITQIGCMDEIKNPILIQYLKKSPSVQKNLSKEKKLRESRQIKTKLLDQNWFNQESHRSMKIEEYGSQNTQRKIRKDCVDDLQIEELDKHLSSVRVFQEIDDFESKLVKRNEVYSQVKHYESQSLQTNDGFKKLLHMKKGKDQPQIIIGQQMRDEYYTNNLRYIKRTEE